MQLRRDLPHLPRVSPRVPGIRAYAFVVTALILVAAAVGVALSRQDSAPATPAFLARQLGPSADTATWSRAHGLALTVRDNHASVTTPAGRIKLSAAGTGAAHWQGHSHGATRPTPFGAQTVTLAGGRAEEYLTVRAHHGDSTWRWLLDSGSATARVNGDGTISFVRDHRVLPMLIRSVQIFDSAGRDVTPAGLHWTLATRGGAQWLQLRLDDRLLPLPYVIDPAIVFQAAASAANAAAPTSPATLTINAPAGVSANDLMVAQIAVNGGTDTTVTAPSGWTLIRRTDNTTNVGEASYYKVATASEPASYAWTITDGVGTPRAAGGILAYAGVNDSSPVDVSSGTSGGSSTSVSAPTVTTTTDLDLVDGLFATDTGTTFTAPSGMTERSDVRNTSANGPSAETADFTKTPAGATGAKAATAGAASNWVAQLVALKLDTVAPTGTVSAPAASSNQHGVITVSSNSADAQSGVASAAFQRSPAGAGTWTTIGTSTTSPYQASWTTTGVTDGLYDLRVVTTDNAGNVTNSATVANVRVDNTNPTGSITTPAASAKLRGTVAVTASSADAGSGVASAAFQESPAGAGTWTSIGTDTTATYSVNWNTTTVTDGLYDLRVITTDNAGNATTSATIASVRVDNTAPANALSLTSISPAGSAYLSGTTVFYHGASAGSFQLQNALTDAGAGPASSAFPALGGTATGWTHTTQTVSTPAGGPYATTNSFAWSAGATSSPTEAVTGTDGSGNTSATTLTFTNDSTAPTGSVTAPAAASNQHGTVTVSSNSADGSSGVAQAVFQRSPAGAGTWTAIGTATTSPYQVSWDTTGVADGLYDLRVVTTDHAGNPTTSATIANVRVDNTAPTGSITTPAAGANVRGAAVTVTTNSADGGSGVASVTFQGSAAGAGTWSTSQPTRPRRTRPRLTAPASPTACTTCASSRRTTPGTRRPPRPSRTCGSTTRPPQTASP